MSKGRVMAEAVMVALTERGMNRQTAHELVRDAAMRSYREDKPLRDILLETKALKNVFSARELDRLMNPGNYLGSAIQQVERVLKNLKR